MINNSKLVSSKMTIQEMYSHALSREVVDLVRSGKCFSDAEAAPLVSKWIQSITPEHRPSVTSVTMDAKRQLWNLASI